MFARLNALGEEVGAPTQHPTSRLGQNNQRQVGVLYGHHGSGKVYNYLAGTGVRTGDIVTPNVTHPKSGKTYKTLARVVYTRDSMGGAAGDTAGELSGRGILLKNVGRTDQQSMPGFRERKEEDKSFTAKKWQEEADKRYEEQKKQRLNMQRLNPMGES